MMSLCAGLIGYSDCTTMNSVPVLWILVSVLNLAHAYLNACVDVMVMVGVNALLDTSITLLSPSSMLIP